MINIMIGGSYTIYEVHGEHSKFKLYYFAFDTRVRAVESPGHTPSLYLVLSLSNAI